MCSWASTASSNVRGWRRHCFLRRRRPRDPRHYSAQSEVVLNGESCVFEDAHGQATANVATCVNGDGDRHVTLRVPQGEMAS